MEPDQKILLDAMGAFNLMSWPLPLVTNVAGLVVVVACIAHRFQTARLIFGILAGMCMVSAIFTSQLHGALALAPFLTLMSVIQGTAFLLVAVGCDPPPQPRFSSSWYSIAGLTIMLVVLCLYPFLGSWAGYHWPRIAFLGIQPVPTMMFTIGVLLQICRSRVWKFMIVPLLWMVLVALTWRDKGMFHDSIAFAPLALGLIYVWPRRMRN
ncbi:hypothetical protein BFP70_13190 [Thioclava sp. SK-1]|uniref:DUF6064 family protein n=1 Tax=Thioclava sp. SK-1 TaxID=1889770 RepID=UPI0008264FB6|nr:DUF6064 family protein [Thioclava sp. SK-1]OCX63157.1 hypothetical protein BFP70_13190 [Thioclava sp. SK-1]